MKKELIKNMVSLIVGEALLEFIENPTSLNIVNNLREKYSEKILSAIDSLQEEPIKQDNCKGCNNVKGCITCVDGSEYAHIEECNITGIKSKEATGKLKELVDNVSEEGLEAARKQLEELTKECMYSKDNYTDEDRKALCDGCEEECEYAQNGKPVSEDLQKAMYLNENGNPTPAKETEYTKGFLKGANWQKEQLMAKAVEGKVLANGMGNPILHLWDKGKHLIDKKVKVIVIKEG